MSLDLSHTFRISPHADLKLRFGGGILVLPERAIRLGGSGEEILRLVEEVGTGDAVLEAMRRRYAESPEIEGDVLAFLEEMVDLGGLVICEGPRGPIA